MSGIEKAMMDDYITVQEFAERAGISHQAVYKGLRNLLQPYVQLVAGRKMLSVKALSEVYGIEVAQPSCETDPEVAQLMQPSFETDATTDPEVAQPMQPSCATDATNDPLVLALQNRIESLEKQIESKDQEITSLLRILEQQNALAMAEKGVMLQLTGESDPDQQQKNTSQKKAWFQFWKR